MDPNTAPCSPGTSEDDPLKSKVHAISNAIEDHENHSSEVFSPNVPIIPAEEPSEDMLYEALEGPTDNQTSEPQQTGTPSKPSQGKAKTPKSFFKKLLSWGSSTKYPPNTPVQESTADVTADRIIGGSADMVVTQSTAYLVSPPRDKVDSLQAHPEVNRQLQWPESEVSKAVCDQKDPEVTLSMPSPPDVQVTTTDHEYVIPIEQRRGSGIGLSLAASMSNAEALLKGTQGRTSDELTMSRLYSSECDHLPVYSQAEMDSALEKLRYELKEQYETRMMPEQESLPEKNDSQPQINEPSSDESERMALLQAQLEEQKMQSNALYHQIKVIQAIDYKANMFILLTDIYLFLH